MEGGKPMKPREVVALLKKGLADVKSDENDAAKLATEETFKRENDGMATRPLNSLATISDLIGSKMEVPPSAPNTDIASVGSDFHSSDLLSEVDEELKI